MSVLSGPNDKSILVGENVELRVVDVRGNMLWPGTTPARPIPIHRKSLYETMSREMAEKTILMLISSS